MPEDDPYTALAVSIGRIEEGIKGMREDLRRMAEGQAEHSISLGAHETRLAVLESQRVPKAPWWSVLAGIASGISIITTGVVVVVYVTTH